MPRRPKKKYDFRLPAEVADAVDKMMLEEGLTPTTFFTEAAIDKVSPDTTRELQLEETRSLHVELKEMRLELVEHARILYRALLTDEEYKLKTEDVDQLLLKTMKHSNHVISQ